MENTRALVGRAGVRPVHRGAAAAGAKGHDAVHAADGGRSCRGVVHDRSGSILAMVREGKVSGAARVCLSPLICKS